MAGHLMMLAGFTAQGDPIVHDPARSNGYSYVYNKTSLSESWFNKGGIAYTFYLHEGNPLAVEQPQHTVYPGHMELLQNYPNPFNPVTHIEIYLTRAGFIEIVVFDVLGRKIEVLHRGYLNAGRQSFTWNAARHPGGNYFIILRSPEGQKIVKAVLLK